MKTKKRLLATAIALSLATSTAFAMPTGGAVVDGSITGLVNGTVANGGTIELNGASGIINWADFSVGANELLKFQLNDGALLNRVTGNNISQLLGTINSDSGFLALSNPNGIIVGENAIINANDLLLTTFDIRKDAFYGFLAGNDLLLSSDKISGIELKNNANLNINDALMLAGGTINIAEGITISANDVSLNAANSMTAGMQDTVIAADVNNRIDMNSANITGKSDIKIMGGAIGIANTNISVADGSQYSGDIEIIAANSISKEGSESGGESNLSIQAAYNNIIDFSGNIKTKTNDINADIKIIGGAVNIADSENIEASGVSIQAVKDYSYDVADNGVINKSIITGIGNDINMSGVTVNSRTAGLSGNNVTVKDSVLKSEGGRGLEISAYNNRETMHPSSNTSSDTTLTETTSANKITLTNTDMVGHDENGESYVEMMGG